MNSYFEKACPTHALVTGGTPLPGTRYERYLAVVLERGDVSVRDVSDALWERFRERVSYRTLHRQRLRDQAFELGDMEATGGLWTQSQLANPRGPGRASARGKLTAQGIARVVAAGLALQPVEADAETELQNMAERLLRRAAEYEQRDLRRDWAERRAQERREAEHVAADALAHQSALPVQMEVV